MTWLRRIRGASVPCTFSSRPTRDAGPEPELIDGSGAVLTAEILQDHCVGLRVELFHSKPPQPYLVAARRVRFQWKLALLHRRGDSVWNKTAVILCGSEMRSNKFCEIMDR